MIALHIISFPAIGWDHVMLPLHPPHTQKCLLKYILEELRQLGDSPPALVLIKPLQTLLAFC